VAGKRKAGKRKAKERMQRPDPRAGNEVLLLWAILGEGGGNAVSRSALNDKGMLPSDDKKARDGLEARRLIEVERRTSRNENGRSVSGYWITVTKAGLAWAEENLAAVPAKSQVAAPILQAWLAHLSIFLHARNIPMTKFLGQHRAVSLEPRTELAITPAVLSHPSPSPLARDDDALRARIRQAYLAVTGDRINTRARLCDIREKLDDIDRTALDEALKRMQREQQASLYPLDNKTEITDADRRAAIYFGSEPRHILWIER
jgi:hypothetical protein